MITLLCLEFKFRGNIDVLTSKNQSNGSRGRSKAQTQKAACKTRKKVSCLWGRLDPEKAEEASKILSESQSEQSELLRTLGSFAGKSIGNPVFFD
jgi:hypothetical protein